MDSSMTWQSFKQHLLAQPDLHLQFKYDQDQLVDASYHLTEIKQAPITSVDCGGKLNTWTEVILQLWEPSEKSDAPAMKVSKVLSIIDIVEKVMPLHPLAIVKVEYGNAQFPTRQMLPSQFVIMNENLVVDLHADTTQCKAIGKGESCGPNASDGDCCAPAVKPKIQLINLAADMANCCTPGSGSGCC